MAFAQPSLSAGRKDPVTGDPELARVRLFDELIERHGREIRLFLQRLCGNHHDAEELTQDVFVKAFRRLDGLRESAAARRWLYTIAVNHFNDWIKPLRRTALRPLGDMIEEDARFASTERPSAQAMADEFSRSLGGWILALPDRQRTVLLLHSTKGFDYLQIGEALGITVDAVKMSLFHAREKLRKKAERMLAP
ncbi:MAG: sigma-70 family RNA polymerase sigma factor [Planctomycetes bacterium]|nr:sigma-70 family RNA polymerase sigma factor [Planctomycetota bacterium]